MADYNKLNSSKMTPEEQAKELIHAYYTAITGSPPGENVNQEALRQAIERAREVIEFNLKSSNIISWWYFAQVLNKLNEM